MATGNRAQWQNEKRRAPRYRYQTALEIEWGSAWLKGRTRDISAGGMFIESEDVLWVGAGFRAHERAACPVVGMLGQAGRTGTWDGRDRGGP